METLRQSKVARLLQRDLGEIFINEARHLLTGALVTVTKVRVSRDLSTARVYLSVFGVSDKEILLKRLMGDAREIRHILAMKIKNQVRVIPELHFHLDDSLDYIERIDELLQD